MRTSPGVSTPRLESFAEQLETILHHRTVNFFLRQPANAPYEILISCCNSSRLDREIKTCTTDGYDEGPPPSKDIIVKEGQIMEVKFRGNIHCVTNDVDLRFIYNTHIKCRLEFEVRETDIFAQKSLQYYRGFAQLSSVFCVPKHITASEKLKQKTPAAAEMIEETRTVSELLINLPKVRINYQYKNQYTLLCCPMALTYPKLHYILKLPYWIYEVVLESALRSVSLLTHALIPAMYLLRDEVQMYMLF